MRLANRVAIVTGSTSGIGKATILAMAAEGARVVVNSRGAEASEKLAGEIRQSGGNALAVPADVTRNDQVEAMVKAALDAFGRVDILVNNAGGVVGSRFTQYLEEVPEEDWDRVLEINLKSAFLCSRAVARHMREQGGGRIINLASEAARNILKAPAGRVQYSAAKAGVTGLTRSMAVELGPHGINVNAVAPGYTLANERQRAGWESMPEDARARVIQDIPLRRLAEVDDVAPVIVFLASDAARYITGVTIDVNGGRTVV
ncbi:MAG: 3-oxoacyl-ACP reductase family protein [Dehalococcoidia bacterium]|nr:3-oxoacyl-ACP reductase family protein [Dehalococcoidia bacterium]